MQRKVRIHTVFERSGPHKRSRKDSWLPFGRERYVGLVIDFCSKHILLPRRTYAWKSKATLAELRVIPAELLEKFNNGPMMTEAINAATLVLRRELIERVQGGEVNHHLGYASSAAKPAAAANQRNGIGIKTVLTEDGPIPYQGLTQSRR